MILFCLLPLVLGTTLHMFNRYVDFEEKKELLLHLLDRQKNDLNI